MLWKEYVLSSIKCSSLTRAEICADLIIFCGVGGYNPIEFCKASLKKQDPDQRGLRFLWHVNCCVWAMGHSRITHGRDLISGLNQGRSVFLYLICRKKMRVTFSQILVTDGPFLIHVISFEVVITPLLTRLILSHTDARASPLLIFRTSLWLFFSFLTWLGFSADKNMYVLAATTACSLSPLSLSLAHSLSLFLFLIFHSLLFFDEFDDPPLSCISFLLSLFSFTLLSFLLHPISVFHPPSYHFYSALPLSLP